MPKITPKTKQLNVSVTVSAISGKFADDQAVLDWIKVCLNSNRKHAVADVQIAQPPIVVLELSGNLIQDKHASGPVRLITIDDNIEGAEEEDITVIDGDEVYVTDYGLLKLAPDYVECVVQEVDD